jgi:hypothetical protein
MQTSEAIDKISPALVKAIGGMGGAKKVGTNDHFKSTYATLEMAVEASRQVLADNELCVIQGAGTVENHLLPLTTRIIHSSGQWIESVFTMPLLKADPQAVLSALTYSRRGALMAILGMPPTDDDDGEAAMGRGKGAAIDAPNPGLEKRLAEKKGKAKEGFSAAQEPYTLDYLLDWANTITEALPTFPDHVALLEMWSNADVVERFKSLKSQDIEAAKILHADVNNRVKTLKEGGQ